MQITISIIFIIILIVIIIVVIIIIIIFSVTVTITFSFSIAVTNTITITGYGGSGDLPGGCMGSSEGLLSRYLTWNNRIRRTSPSPAVSCVSTDPSRLMEACAFVEKAREENLTTIF